MTQSKYNILLISSGIICISIDTMLIRFAMRLNINDINNIERNIHVITLIYLLEFVMFPFFQIVDRYYLHLCEKRNTR